MMSFPTEKTNETTRRWERVTLYTTSDYLGILHVECRWLMITVAPYAQHEAALHLRFVPKGKRKERGTVRVPASWQGLGALVVKGWGHPKPANFGPWEHSASGAASRRSRFRSCDPRWASVADEAAAGGEVLYDSRRIVWPVVLYVTSEGAIEGWRAPGEEPELPEGCVEARGWIDGEGQVRRLST